MDKLYIENLGTGPDLVLLHGWGLHGGIWQGIKADLAQYFRLHIVDLPGFGYSHKLDAEYAVDLNTIVDTLENHLPNPAIWLGWSLGGCIAMAAAAKADSGISKLITVASNPKFVADSSWQSGMKKSVLNNFAELLDKDFSTTINRFLMIQTMGSPDQKEQLKQLKSWLLERPEPNAKALRSGLTLLDKVDLRRSLAELKQTHLSILGRKDALVPSSLQAALTELAPNTQQRLYLKSSHAPFISEPKKFVQEVLSFCFPKGVSGHG